MDCEVKGKLTGTTQKNEVFHCGFLVLFVLLNPTLNNQL